MKDILFITHFTQIPGESGNNRFNYVIKNLDKSTIRIELITTDFSHKKKTHRQVNNSLLNEYDYRNTNITLLHELGYKKNVSIKRFYSHYVFSKNVHRYLETRKKPDLIYCSVPSLDVGKVVAKYAKEKNVKLIIDVQDLWPEAFKMIFNIPIISDIVFYPMKKKADYIYGSADEIIAVSKTYLSRALDVNSKVKDGKVVFLGTDLNKFDEAFINNKYQNKPESEFWVAYAGTLGHSYDIISVIDALEILKQKGFHYLKFIVMGDGPLKEKFEKYAEKKGVEVLFTGRLPYSEMVGLLGVCDIAVNPITSGSAGSIINKHGDYAASGLPVLNTQESLEYRNLVDEYQMGLNCNNNDPKDLAEKLQVMLEDSELKEKMGKNSRRLAEEKFDRKRTYDSIYKMIL